MSSGIKQNLVFLVSLQTYKFIIYYKYIYEQFHLAWN